MLVILLSYRYLCQGSKKEDLYRAVMERGFNEDLKIVDALRLDELPHGKLMCLLEQGVADGVFRQLKPRHTAINIVGTCAFYFITLENIEYLWPCKKMLGKGMRPRHAQSALDMILAGILAEPYGGKSIDATLTALPLFFREQPIYGLDPKQFSQGSLKNQKNP